MEPKEQIGLGLSCPEVDENEMVEAVNPDDGGILPGWNGTMKVLAAPNCMLRSSLFSVAHRTGKTFLKRHQIKCVAGVEMRYTGLVLTQVDLDVWHGLLCLQKDQHNPDKLDFGVKPFLKMIGRSDGKSDREWIKASVSKMTASLLEITNGDITYGGSLIDEFYREESTGRYLIKLNQKLASLFVKNSWTGINWMQRKALQKKPLAMWLHAFYSTHRAPYDYSVEKIMELCGSEGKDRRDFRRQMKTALVEVASVTGWECYISDAADMITINKPAAAPVTIERRKVSEQS